MTAFARSVLARRNPRNVPLDLFEAGAPDPYPYPFDDPTLSADEKIRRDIAISNHRAELEWSYDRRVAESTDKYRDIFSEIIRGISETLWRMESSGLFEPVLSGEGWRSFGTRFATVLRDLSAAEFTLQIWNQTLHLPGATTRRWYWHDLKKKHTIADLQKRYEERVVLLARWLIAKCQFEGRPEIRAARGLHPIGHPDQLASDLTELKKWVVAIQSAMSERHTQRAFTGFDLLRKAVLKTLRDRGGLGAIAEQYEKLAVAKIPTLKSEASKAEKLAAKGEPKVSRKFAKAEEARIAALERSEPKQNPFLSRIFMRTSL
jgi:hypothetical protein